MSSVSSSSAPLETGAVTVRYWASARSAAGVEADQLAVAGPVSLAEVTQQVLALHRGSRLSDVIAVCSVLVGDRPAGTARSRPGRGRAGLHGGVPPTVRRRMSGMPTFPAALSTT